MAVLEDRDVGWLDRAPIRIDLERTTTADPDVVFGVLADHEAWPRWVKAMRRVAASGDGGVGQTRTVDMGVLRVDERMVAWEPGRRFAFLVTRSSVPGLRAMLEDFRLREQAAGGTVIAYAGGVELRRGVAWLRPVFRATLRRQLAAMLDGLAAEAARRS